MFCPLYKNILVRPQNRKIVTVWSGSFKGWSCNHNPSFSGAAFVSLPCHLDFVGCCCCVNTLFTWWLVLLRIDDQELKLYKAVKSCFLSWRTGKPGWWQHSRTGWNRWGAEQMAAARQLSSLHHSLPRSEQAGWVAMEMFPLGQPKGWDSESGGHAGAAAMHRPQVWRGQVGREQWGCWQGKDRLQKSQEEQPTMEQPTVKVTQKCPKSVEGTR